MPRVGELGSSDWETGVYCWKNLVNGKVYVGSAAGSLEERRKDHLKRLTGNYHYNYHFQAAWNKYGAKLFQFRVIERCLPDHCVTREQFWMDKYQASDKRFGYNISPTAGSQLGFKHSEETCKANGDRKRGTKQTEEAKAKVGEATKKRWEDPEHRAMRIARMKQTPKMGMANAKRSLKMTGKGISEEHKKKIGISHQGERSVNAKLTERDVKEIRNTFNSQSRWRGMIREWARRFDLNEATIRDVICYKTWKHLP